MTRYYAVANQKGGVGKTTSVINLGAYMAAAGRKILIVDVDPQCNATSGLGYNKEEIESSVYNVILDELDPAAIITPYQDSCLSLLPSSPNLAGAEVELVNVIAREYRLRGALEQIDGQFDYVFIDCPPSLGLLTINALTAARSGVIIPVQCEYLALEGLSQLIKTIHLVARHLNPTLSVRGLLMTMYDARTNLSRQVVEEVRAHFAGQVFRSIIPRNIRLSEAPSFGQPISEYAPTSPGALAYKLLATEVMKIDERSQS